MFSFFIHVWLRYLKYIPKYIHEHTHKYIYTYTNINNMTPVADLSKVLDLSILRDKSVIVTGGASGLGALIATKFAENGHALDLSTTS